MNKSIEVFAKYVAQSAGLDADKFQVLDYDLYRVYCSYNGAGYDIRMWNITNEEVREYTLYRMVSDGRGSHGEPVYRGEHYYL